jgi:type I restriction enzyme R subunit
VARLSEIVDVLNERFGTNLGPADQLLFEQTMRDMTHDEDLGQQARANPIEQFRFAFDPKAMDALVSRVERNAEVAGLLLTNAEARAVALDLMMQDVYARLRQSDEPADAVQPNG